AVSVNVSDTKDFAGTTQEETTTNRSGTNLESATDLVLSVVLNDAHLTDADATLTRTATITFSEAMDTSVAPTVSNDAGSTLTNPTNGHWTDATHYTVDYTVDGKSTRLNSSNFYISYAKYVADNNKVAAPIVSSGTNIDTET